MKGWRRSYRKPLDTNLPGSYAEEVGGGGEYTTLGKITLGFLKVCRDHSLVAHVPSHKHLLTKCTAGLYQLSVRRKGRCWGSEGWVREGSQRHERGTALLTTHHVY